MTENVPVLTKKVRAAGPSMERAMQD